MQVPVSKLGPQKGRGDNTLSIKREAELSSQEQRNILFQGASLSDLMIIFRLDRRTIQSRIADVPSCGKRNGGLIYQIRDVAPYLVRPSGDIEEHIRKMRPNDLPALLSKEFWNGQRSKLRYLEEVGQLWRTDRVLTALAEVFKTVRMNLLLLPDALERKAALNDKQLDEIRMLIDGTLEETRNALIEQFEDDERGPGVDEADAVQGTAENVFNGEFESEDEDEWGTPSLELDTGDL